MSYQFGNVISYQYTNDILESMQMNLASHMASSFSISGLLLENTGVALLKTSPNLALIILF